MSLLEISAILLAGRIKDFKTEQDVYRVIDMNYEKLTEMLKTEFSSTSNNLSSVIAFLVAAYLKGTDKLESLKEIIRLYIDFNRDIHLVTEQDVLATILLTGKLKKITKFLTINDINDLIGGIKQLLGSNNAT